MSTETEKHLQAARIARIRAGAGPEPDDFEEQIREACELPTVGGYLTDSNGQRWVVTSKNLARPYVITLASEHGV